MREKCADLIAICEANTDCACLVTCTGENGIPGVDACLTTCKLSARPDNWNQVEECTAVACPDPEDECATPSDWKPQPTDSCDRTGSGPLADGTLADCAFDPTLSFDPKGSVLQLESEDGQFCLRLRREDAGAGTLANTSWTLLEMQLGPLGQVTKVDAAAELCWYSSHHNFRDWAHVSSGTRHYDLALLVDIGGGPSSYELYVYESSVSEAGVCAPGTDGSMCISGPVKLVPYQP